MATKDNSKNSKVVQKREEGSGLCKSVPAGDTVVLILQSPSAGGPPPEKEITMSSLNAPKPAHWKGAKDDEPFAAQSRDFLRKKVIGKVLNYTIEYIVEGNNNRVFSYGTISLNGEVLNNLVVSEGWCKVKAPPAGKNVREDTQSLLNLSQQAESEGKGVFGKQTEDSIRRFVNLTPGATQKLLAHNLQGVVESVRDGTSLRVSVHANGQWYEPLVCLAGAQSPVFRFDSATQEHKPEPFAREAKFLVERLLLHRDVQVTLHGVDKQQNAFGTVLFNGKNICEELIRSGLAKFVQWNAPAASVEAWKKLESDAKAQRLRLWKDEAAHVNRSPAAPAGVAIGVPFEGKVREIQGGGSIVVEVGTERRVLPLSSIVAPRFLSIKEKESGKEDEPYAHEAKEFLRSRLIGRKVTCTLDYVRPRVERKVDKPELPEKPFYTVLSEKQNIAVKLVEEGLATVTVHRKDDPCSPNYDQLLQAEARAKQKGKGVHGKSDVPTKPLDLSKDPKGAKKRFPFFERAGRQPAVIEYVFNPTRFRVVIPKERVIINFALSSLRPSEDEKILAASTQWTRDKLHQRDVEVEIEAQDRGGTFLGYLYLKKKYFASTLVELGHARISGPNVTRLRQISELQTLEEVAKKEKRGLWQNFDPEAEKRRIQQEEEEAQKAASTKKEVLLEVTEVIDGCSFYAHFLGEEHKRFEEINKEISAGEHPLVDPAALRNGSLAIAQFSGDGGWYRARIEGQASPGQYRVSFIDYGNSDVVPLASIRKMDAKFAAVPPAAKECHLAFIKTNPVDDEYGREAALTLRDMVWGKQVVGHIEYRSGNTHYLMVGDPESEIHVNAYLVHHGLARVEKSKASQSQANAVATKLREEEERAKKSHIGIWRYGDDDDDEY